MMKSVARAHRRWLDTLNVTLFVLSALALGATVIGFSERDEYRVRLDATKTRAYSLSPQSRQLLNSLPGDWKIAIVMSEKRATRAIRRQMDEVLKRYAQAAPRLTVRRIDPDRPETLLHYDELVGDLRRVYADPINAYDRALDGGLAALAALQSFAQQQSPILEQVAARMPATEPDRPQLQQRLGILALFADRGSQILELVRKARRPDGARPLPDYEGARSVLAQALSQWAGELDEFARLFARWQGRADLDTSVKQFATVARREFSDVAQRLAEAADPLKRLPPLELGHMGAELSRTECAVIIGPDRAAVIPSAQLFPKANVKALQSGGVRFDQRFRGEQLISAAIRSLLVERMPRVVFVHAENEPLLQRRDPQRNADLVGVAQALQMSRYEVAEWNVAQQRERPGAAPGQSVVWVIVPPPPARIIEASGALHALAEAVGQLLDDGASVLLSVSPSVLPKYGQADPLAALASPFGLVANTGAIILESIPAPERAAKRQTTLGQSIRDFPADHPISRAIDGQQTYFGMPVPLGITNHASENVQRSVIASILPSPNRWMETDWMGDLTTRPVNNDAVLNEPVPVVVAAQRHLAGKHDGNGAPGRPQRFMLVGSGGWMISNVADAVWDIGGGAGGAGGGRVALINPGNHELMLASVAWLAGMDDLIAASPMSQDVARLRHITPETRLLWFWLVVAGLPALCLGLGSLVWLWRRSAR
jgi:hypothetical protein